MQAIILAGGKATRLPESAKDIPKALVHVGGKPILAHQIDQLQQHGFFDIRLARGYKAEQIISYVAGVKLQHNQHSIDWVIEREPLDTGGAIKLAARGLREPFLVLNGDILSDVHIENFAKKFSRNAKMENAMVVAHLPDARSYGMIKKRGTKVLEFLEKPVLPISGYVNVGFYILSPHIFKNIEEKKFSIEKNVFPTLAAQGKLGYYIHRGFWTDAGTEERLLAAKLRFEPDITKIT
ncbi:MAG: NDP-sugar synthase [Candidatus Spechtbacteria bacterium]|nr:NDP-sugar synthase [Candidatus Spechtbacteria bacterium]